MSAKASTLSVLFVIGGAAFAVANAQSTVRTASVSATGAVTEGSGWISSVSVNNDASATVSYVMNFSGGAPAATACSVTSARSGLNLRLMNPVNMPDVLVVAFTPSAPNQGVVGFAATNFTLTCGVAASSVAAQSVPPAAMATTTQVTTAQAATSQATTALPLLQGTHMASISSTAAVSNNDGWISSVTFTGATYPPNSYVVELAGRSPGASNCHVNPDATAINGYTFAPALIDGGDGTSIIVQYAPVSGAPQVASIPANVAFTLTCAFPSS